METMTHSGNERRHPGSLGLIGLILGLVLGAGALYAVGGPPHLPAELPSWELIVITLQGSSVPYEALAYILTMAAWAVWFWMVASLLLRVLVVSAEAVTQGAAWVRSLRTLSDWVTIPMVRRVVDGAVIAALAVSLVSRTTPTVDAAPLAPQAMVNVTVAPKAVASPAGDHHERRQEADEGSIAYTVQPGDSLGHRREVL
ncbi:MAG: hypothetical protein NTZ05_07655 [Chloroflexi bacterium]|nr:hypothetical protein [Chloroflexota bacterium]